ISASCASSRAPAAAQDCAALAWAARRRARAARACALQPPCPANACTCGPSSRAMRSSCLQPARAAHACKCPVRRRLATLLSIAFLNAFPPLADGRQYLGHFVDHGRVELDAGAVQPGRAKFVDARQVGHGLATALEIKRARQPIDDLDALV